MIIKAKFEDYEIRVKYSESLDDVLSKIQSELNKLESQVDILIKKAIINRLR